MKRPLIITIGIVIILLVLGVWVYLLLFGTPDESNDVFTNLGFDLNPREATIVDTVEVEEETSVDVSSGLQQLTTRPVAGFVHIEMASSSMIRYAEQGTGHIYEIDMLTGKEDLISRTTLPRVRSAVFSDDGTMVALISLHDTGKNMYAAMIDVETGTLVGGSLDTPISEVDNVSFVSDSTFAYTVNTNSEQIGYHLEVAEVESSYKEVFRVPFKDTQVVWGESETHLYNSSAETLMGYLYEIRGGTFYSTNVNGFGMIATVGDEYVGFQKRVDDNNVSGFVDRTTGEELGTSVQIVPEKCVFSNQSAEVMWCADTFSGYGNSITDWYKGTLSMNDVLWEINIPELSATLKADLFAISGRPIDVTDIDISTSDSVLLFLNKDDNTLWKYDIE